MKEHASSYTRRPLRWALLPVVTVIGVLAGLSNAFALDQQATDDEMDDAINWRAARGGSYFGPFGQEGTIYLPRHRDYR